MGKVLGLVGAGRVARHMTFYFQKLGWKIESFQRGDKPEKLHNCSLIGLAVNDISIETVAHELRNSGGGLHAARFFHFSGAHQSPSIFSFHPLMTFGKDLYELSFYERIPFASELASPEIYEIFPGLPNPVFQIPYDQKPYYHALCVMAGNFTTLLWQKFFDEMSTRFRIPHEASSLYLEKIVENLKNDPKSALTGPLSRGDDATIQKNLASLQGDPFQNIYFAFVKAYLEGRKKHENNS